MSLELYANLALATVSIGYNNTATSIVLTTGHGVKLPAAPFNAVWWNSTDYVTPDLDPNVEIVRVTAKSTDTLTIVRGQESITATTKNTASKTYKLMATPTAKSMNAIPAVYVSGIGQSGITTTTATTSLLPGGTPISIPGGTLNPGDLVFVRAVYGHVGGSTSISADATLNSFFGGWGGTPFTGAGATAELWIAVQTTNIQTIGCRFFSGGSFGAPTARQAFNLANPLTIDINGGFGATPTGGESLSLDHYSVAIHRNVS